MFFDENFYGGYSGESIEHDLGISIQALVVEDTNKYFEQLALKSEFESLALQSNNSEMKKLYSTRYFLNPVKWKYMVRDKSKEEMAKQLFTNIANFEFLMSLIWHSVFPCHHVLDYTICSQLKKCKWKGIELPCESIFSKTITDDGLCCSFNRDTADEIYVESTFTKMLMELQLIDKLKTPTLGKVPEWYYKKQEPKTKTGHNMGLYIEIDSCTGYLTHLSIKSDFKSQTILIGPSGKNNITKL